MYPILYIVIAILALAILRKIVHGFRKLYFTIYKWISTPLEKSLINEVERKKAQMNELKTFIRNAKEVLKEYEKEKTDLESAAVITLAEIEKLEMKSKKLEISFHEAIDKNDGLKLVNKSLEETRKQLLKGQKELGEKIIKITEGNIFPDNQQKEVEIEHSSDIELTDEISQNEILIPITYPELDNIPNREKYKKGGKHRDSGKKRTGRGKHEQWANLPE